MTRKEQLLAYLEGTCRGRKYRTNSAELKCALHLSSTDLRKMVNRLRQERNPIASDREGYFYATNAGEIYSTIQNLKKMRAGLDAAIRGLEASLDNFSE